MGDRSNRLEGTRDLEGAGAAVGAGGAGGATPWSEDELQAFRFAAQTLAALFLNGPETPQGKSLVEALAELDIPEASREWPFVEAETAREPLGELVDGARMHVEEARDAAEEGRPVASTALPRAYSRLVKGPGRLVAPPWGSVYTDRDGVIFGKSTLALRSWMRRNGISMTLDEKVPEDHIGLMLQQALLLAGEKPDLLDEFLRDHLLTWSHHYLGLLRDAATDASAGHLRPMEPMEGAELTAGKFYRGLAVLADLTLEGIREARGIEVAYPKYFR